jgi:hypothetical protein
VKNNVVWWKILFIPLVLILLSGFVSAGTNLIVNGTTYSFTPSNPYCSYNIGAFYNCGNISVINNGTLTGIGGLVSLYIEAGNNTIFIDNTSRIVMTNRAGGGFIYSAAGALCAGGGLTSGGMGGGHGAVGGNGGGVNPGACTQSAITPGGIELGSANTTSIVSAGIGGDGKAVGDTNLVSTPGSGGLVGGPVKLVAKNIIINGIINVTGTDGSCGSTVGGSATSSASGGGGGSGGTIYIDADSVNLTNAKLYANGGNGGCGSIGSGTLNTAAGGGGGSGGRIKIFYHNTNYINTSLTYNLNGGAAGTPADGSAGSTPIAAGAGGTGTFYATASLINCYQEFANQSTACGGLSTGNYASVGNFSLSQPYINGIDGNYGTYSGFNNIVFSVNPYLPIIQYRVQGMTTDLNGNVYANSGSGTQNQGMYEQYSGDGPFYYLTTGFINSYMSMTTTLNNDVYVWKSPGIYKRTNSLGDFVLQNWTVPPGNPSQMVTAKNGNIYLIYGNQIWIQYNATGNFINTNTTIIGVNNEDRVDGMTVAQNGDIYVSYTWSYNGLGDIYIQKNATGNFYALNQTLRRYAAMTATPDGNIYVGSYSGDGYVRYNGQGDFIPLNQSFGSSPTAATTKLDGTPYIAGSTIYQGVNPTTYINYSIPINATWDSVWNIVTYNNLLSYNYSLIIPRNCWNNPNILKLAITESGNNIYAKCYDNTKWIIISTMNDSGLYDESMNWVLTAPVTDSSLYSVSFPIPNNAVLNYSTFTYGFTNNNPYYNYTKFNMSSYNTPLFNINAPCFQESFNVANQTGIDTGNCGSLYTGTSNAPTNATDGNYSTKIVAENGNTYIYYFNYTLPASIVNTNKTVKWWVKYIYVKSQSGSGLHILGG